MEANAKEAKIVAEMTSAEHVWQERIKAKEAECAARFKELLVAKETEHAKTIEANALEHAQEKVKQYAAHKSELGDEKEAHAKELEQKQVEHAKSLAEQEAQHEASLRGSAQAMAMKEALTILDAQHAQEVGYA
jgi:hypothetical protein